jgi:radical SAM protein with 4Fe4S-binding SPASM domain
MLELGKRESCGTTTTLPELWSVPVAFKSIGFLRKTAFSQRCCFLNLLSVLADGTISCCGMGVYVKAFDFGKVGRVDMTDLWNTHPVLVETRKVIPYNFEGVCGKCIFKSFCLGHCRAEVYLKTCSITAPFWFCEKTYEMGLFPYTRLVGVNLGQKGGSVR